MITTSDALNTYEFKSYYIIMPNSEFISQKKHNDFKKFIKINKAKRVKKNFCYNSLENNHYLSINELQNLISKTII